MKEEWLLEGAAVPVTCETVTALVAEIHRLIGVVGGMALAQPEPWTPEDTAYRPGGMAQPEQVDCPRCGHVCSQRGWVGLTDEEIIDVIHPSKATHANCLTRLKPS